MRAEKNGYSPRPFVLGLLGAAVFFVCVFFSLPAAASGGETGIEALVAYAVEHNPGLRAARLEWLKSLQMGPQASAWDDPMLSYTYPIEPIETRLGPQEHIVSLSQRFPFPGKPGVKGEIAGKGAEIARLKYEKALRQVAYEVRKSYYELFYYGKAASLAREQIDVFDFFIKAEMSDYAVGRKDLNDVVDAQTRYADASNDLVIFEELEEAERTHLNTLLNRAPEEPVGKLAEPAAHKPERGIDELYALALDSEDAVIAGKEVEKSALEERLARYTYLPDFQLGVNYSAIGRADTGVMDSGRDAASVTFGMTIPIWFGKNRAAGEQARLERERAAEQRASVENGLRNRVKRIYAEANTNHKLVELYSGSLIPKAKELIEIAQIRYRNGEGGIAGVFNAQTMWLNFNLAYYRALANYLAKTAEMESLIGRRIEKDRALLRGD